MWVAHRLLPVARATGRTADWLVARPRVVLASLVVAQIAVTGSVALAAEHDGWVWFEGDDAASVVTQAWHLGRLGLVPTELGYLWSLAVAPITWVTGSAYADALPAVVPLQVLVLGPIALLCVYGIAARIGGSLLGYWASLVWMLAPVAATPLFDPRYDDLWIDQVLPQMLGLTAVPEYPSTVALLASAYFLVRSLGASSPTDAALAGLLLGAAGGIHPPSLLMGVGAGLAYVVARRWREGLVLGAALGAAVLVLVLWRERVLGRLAIGELDLDIDHWRGQLDQLREYFWSQWLVQWAPLAGLVAVLMLRRFAVAALLGGWLGAVLAVEGLSPEARIDTGTFWIVLLPAWPAFLLLVAAIPLLVPTLARRLGERLRPPERTPARARWVAVVAALVVVLPAVVIAASSVEEATGAAPAPLRSPVAVP